ncbi:MAG TPA: SAM-dependent chlorinase/fluorinase [Nocardioidaceae bacterium]|nr:SAM-dependent chlorinase/fluorinase [Nocardioidaceae bacterium]
MSRYRCLGFLTDYGLEDGFVAVCHGVVMSIVPEARIVDVSHQVPPYDVRRGAMVLARSAPYLDPAVFVAVVDPGVGGDRRAVAVATESSVLVGPDNGLLLPAADLLGGVTSAVELDRDDLFLRPVSATFHGRDIFAPIAARLLGGSALDDVGSPIDPDSLHRLPEPRVVEHADGVDAEVVDVDHYGNVQLAVRWPALDVGEGDDVVIRVESGEHRIAVGRQFTSVPSGAMVLYPDADARAAIAVNGGSAAGRLDVARGATVRLSRGPSD